MAKFWKNKKIIGLAIAAIVSTMLALSAALAWMNVLQLRLADNLYHPRKTSDQIVVIAIDDKTLDVMGPYELWPRDNFAKALANVNKYNPKIAAFDVYFKRLKNNDADLQLQEELKKTTNPIINFPGNPVLMASGQFELLKSDSQNDLPLELYSKLQNVTTTVAKILPDQDKVFRNMPTGFKREEDNLFYDSFAFAVVKLSLGNKYSTLKIPLEQNQMLINFATKPNDQQFSYKEIPFVDVYNDHYANINPADFFKDKIVLIGPAADHFKDKLLTPMSSTDLMSGIVIHANAIQTILEQKFLRNMSVAEKVGLIVLLAFLSTFVFMYTRTRWSVLYLFAVPAAYTLMAPFAFDHGLILDLVHPYLVLAATFISVYVYRYVTEFKQKMELKGAFEKYLNPGMVDKIMAHPEQMKLGGEKREVTVLFTDIAHSTTISEKLTPESLVALLNEYFEAMSEVIMANGGTLDKFEGDAIMAFFGAPVSQNDHEALACKTALQMRQKLSQLLKKWQTDPPLPGGEPKPQIDFRCGLSSGEVIVGNVGSLHKFNYTVMGDIVNLGSRLEGANKKYETHTMVSQKTADKVTTRFEMRVLDTIRVVGKKEPIKVYELLAEKGQLPANVMELLSMYGEGIKLYNERKFAEGLAKFQKILETYPDDGPSKLYRQRCEVLRDFPPKPEWDGVYEMGSK